MPPRTWPRRSFRARTSPCSSRVVSPFTSTGSGSSPSTRCGAGSGRALPAAGNRRPLGLRRERRGRRDLPASRLPAAGDRAGRRPREDARAASAAGTARAAAAAPCRRLALGTGAAADAARDDRLELRTAHAGRAGDVRQARSLRRRLHPRGGRGDLRSRRRRDRVTRRQEPAPSQRRPLLDVADDPGVRARAARGERGGRRRARSARRALPRARRARLRRAVRAESRGASSRRTTTCVLRSTISRTRPPPNISSSPAHSASSGTRRRSLQKVRNGSKTRSHPPATKGRTRPGRWRTSVSSTSYGDSSRSG